jgi:hypothetical protein
LVANTGNVECLNDHGILSFFDKNGKPITIEGSPSDSLCQGVDDTYTADEMIKAGKRVDEYLNYVPSKGTVNPASVPPYTGAKSAYDADREERHLQATHDNNIRSAELANEPTDASSDTADGIPAGIPSIVASAKDIINNATGIPPEVVKSAKDVLAAANTAGSSAGILPTIARLAALAAVKLKQYVNKPFDKEQDKQEPIDMGPVQYADDDKPLALPAPDKTPDMLTPELQRMKDLAGIKQKKK